MFTRACLHIALGLASSLLASCNYKDNPNYCPENLHDNCLDEGGPCDDDLDCTGGRAVCDTAATGICVQCTPERNDACSGATPACIDNVCQPCTSHDQCDSQACLIDDGGTCAAPSDVAYVQADGAGTACTLAAPCGTLAFAVATGKRYVKLAAGTVKDVSATTIEGRRLTILAAPGAILDRDGDGPILVVRGLDTNVSISDLEIAGATGTNDAALQLEPSGGNPTLSLTRVSVANNQGRGISARGGMLSIERSKISGNANGGIWVTDASFAIVGNTFFGNGSFSGNVGGISINTTQSAANRLEFNSFHKNAAADGFGSAIQCFAGAFTARNNIVSENGTLTNTMQVAGSCAHAFSIVRPGAVPPGDGNSNMDPLFVNTTTGDLHVRAGSPVRGTADPNSNLTGAAARDLDGDARTSPADIGADEIQ